MEGTRSSAAAEDPILSPVKKSLVWKHFGYRKTNKDNKTASCKLCEKPVAHAGGTTNLKNLYVTGRSTPAIQAYYRLHTHLDLD